MKHPLVTVICISFNHALYVGEALMSLKNQTYKSIQIIVADDASTDASQQEIEAFMLEHPGLNIGKVFNEQNTGNCALFNKALALAEGKYIIDLSADDYLYETCIEQQVSFFESQPEHVGVIFSNVDLVNEQGVLIKKHYEVNLQGYALSSVPQGQLYKEIVSTYFISPVGMVMKKEVLDQLGGYDESLAYEDFDFWVRSSRFYEYAYLDACVAAKRILPRSHSTKFLSKGYENMFVSTARVCEKIIWLNKVENQAEKKALLQRIHYEIRKVIQYHVKEAFEKYIVLLKVLDVNPMIVSAYRLAYYFKTFF